MKPHDVMGMIFILILVYLLINNSSKTQTVVQGLAGASTQIISTLQGNSSGFGNISTPSIGG